MKENQYREWSNYMKPDMDHICMYIFRFKSPFSGFDFKLKSLSIINSLTWEMLILEPFEPATTMDLKLLYSDSDFCAEDPVLSRASFRIRLTWFSKVCLRVLPGVGSNSLLWAFSMTWERSQHMHDCIHVREPYDIALILVTCNNANSPLSHLVWPS